MNMNNTCVILLVVYSVIHAALAEDAIIEFNGYKKYFDGYQCDPENRPIAFEDEPTSIRVYLNNNDSSKVFTYGNCYNQYKAIQLNKTKDKNIFWSRNQLELNISDNKLSCNFYASRFTQICDTHFHIRTKTPLAQIYLNSEAVAATRTPLDVREYDATALYYFKHGETVVIYCTHSQELGYSKIMYFNNKGGKLLETIYSSAHVEGNKIHIKLTQESHYNYVDCYYKNIITPTNNINEHLSVTRILFKLLREQIDNGIITLHINGMYVRPTGPVYEYVYYAGETADISCESRREDHLINLTYHGHNEECLSKVNKTIYHLDKKDDKTVVNCTLIDKYTHEVKASVSIKLIKGVSDIYITGLSKSNILQQYRETESSSVINYQFADKELLSLNCSLSKYNAKNLRWIFNGSSVNATEETRSVITSIYLEIGLQASYDNLTIKCILEPNINLPETHQIVIRLAYIGDKDFLSTYWTWISSGIVMIVITIIIIYNVRNYKKRRNERRSSNMNLVSSPDSPLPHPRQWNEANYTELIVSDIYNEPDHENRVINKGHTSNNVSHNYYATVNNNSSRNIVIELSHEYTYILPVNAKTLEKTDADNSRVKFTDTNTGGSHYEDTNTSQDPSNVNSRVGVEPVEHIYCEIK